MSYAIIPDSEYKQMFKDTIKELALAYERKHNGGIITVNKLIFGDRWINISQQIDLLSYFLYSFQGDRSLSDIKLKEFTDFIRAERNRLFKNSYKNNPRKFIKHEEFGRAKTMYDYVNNYILDNTKTVKRKSTWK